MRRKIVNRNFFKKENGDRLQPYELYSNKFEIAIQKPPAKNDSRTIVILNFKLNCS